MLGSFCQKEKVMTKREYFKQLRESRRAQESAELARLIPNPRYKTKYTFSEISKGLDKFPRLITPEQLAQLTQMT
jgi:hypothetical protein